MPNSDIAAIKEKITAQHGGDGKQLEVIFSDSPRLIVEAPAGYGKTTTMISRIAYLYATGGIPNPKRILGLTFSVNAALKVKREVAEKLPELLGIQNSPIAVSEKVTVTNYHGFCKSVLRKYGYLLTDALRKDVNLFKATGDSDICRRTELATVLNQHEAKTLMSMEQSIKDASVPDEESIRAYNKIVIEKLLPIDFVTHNAVILFVAEIFAQFAEVQKFYQNLYPLIVVDEFQDTNCIAWGLLESLIADKTNLIFLGDPLQRIYGFIGALPDIMVEAAEKYEMAQIALSQNHRFKDNLEMLKLDANIRANAATAFSPIIIENAHLPTLGGKTQENEAEKIVAKVQSIISAGDERIAVLCRARGKNADIIEEQLISSGIPYFYGMFTDDDSDYIDFHNECQEAFVRRFGKQKHINKKALAAFSDGIKKVYESIANKTSASLLLLLDALIEKVAVDYAELQAEDKYDLMVDVFENRQLKQAMEYVDSQVILSTVHGAKGLEWDFVILTDVEQWVYTFVCKDCQSSLKNAAGKSYCRLPQPVPIDIQAQLLDDLCVFYVGLTRARKQVYISASSERFNASGRQFTNGKICCLAMVDGVKLVKAENYDESPLEEEADE
jgi:DNA helicase-2/ATP-dependent DNA helicase PcrA